MFQAVSYFYLNCSILKYVYKISMFASRTIVWGYKGPSDLKKNYKRLIVHHCEAQSLATYFYTHFKLFKIEHIFQCG